MAKSSRDKGKLGEREVAAVFTSAGLPAQRTAQLQAGSFPGAADVAVLDLPDLYVESKRRETYDLPGWERQVERECPEGMTPLIAYRKSRQPWRAVVPLEHYAQLRAELRELRRLLDHFDRYASVPDGTPYAGSPFEAEVKDALS